MNWKKQLLILGLGLGVLLPTDLPASAECVEDAKAHCDLCCGKVNKNYKEICLEICLSKSEDCSCPKCPAVCPGEGETPEMPKGKEKEKEKPKKPGGSISEACDPKEGCWEAASLTMALLSAPADLAKDCNKALNQCYEGLRKQAESPMGGGMMGAGAIPGGGGGAMSPEKPCDPTKLCKKLFDQVTLTGPEVRALAETCSSALVSCAGEEEEMPGLMGAGAISGGGGGMMSLPEPKEPPPVPTTSPSHPDNLCPKIEKECEGYARAWSKPEGEGPEVPESLAHLSQEELRQIRDTQFAVHDGKLFPLEEFYKAYAPRAYQENYQRLTREGMDMTGVLTPEQYAKGLEGSWGSGTRFLKAGNKVIPLVCGQSSLCPPDQYEEIKKLASPLPDLPMMDQGDYEAFFRMTTPQGPTGIDDKKSLCIDVTNSAAPYCCPRFDPNGGRCGQAVCRHAAAMTGDPEPLDRVPGQNLKSLARALQKEFSPTKGRLRAFAVLNISLDPKALKATHQACAKSLAGLAAEDPGKAAENARGFFSPACSLFSVRVLGQEDYERFSAQLLKAGAQRPVRGGDFQTLLESVEKGAGTPLGLRAARELAGNPLYAGPLSDWAGSAKFPGRALELLAARALGQPPSLARRPPELKDWDELRAELKRFGVAEDAAKSLVEQAKKPEKNLTPQAVLEALILRARGASLAKKGLSEAELFSECARSLVQRLADYQGEDPLGGRKAETPLSELQDFLKANPGADGGGLAQQNLACAEKMAMGAPPMAELEEASDRIWFTWRVNGGLLQSRDERERGERIEDYEKELAALPSESEESCAGVCSYFRGAISLSPEDLHKDQDSGRKVCEASCAREGSGKRGRISGSQAARELLGALFLLEPKRHPGLLKKWKARIKGLAEDKTWHQELLDTLLLPFHPGIEAGNRVNMKEVKKKALKAAVELRP